ncbi:hypothetical protein [Acinetobacter sp. ESBL14]|uniref:hypothetical protein n=1 Tax=Acinetobacter sp. ESBL14 TaxID=3077329 RepID=UPI002FC7BB86
MPTKTLNVQLFINDRNVLSNFPVDEIEINVNGGYTHWNKWKDQAQGNGSFFIGVDLSRFATLARDQAINRSILPGTFISSF